MALSILRNKYVKKILGVVLIVGGIAGLFLPFLQGIAMIIVGLALLGNKRSQRYANKLKRWWQKKKVHVSGKK